MNVINKSLKPDRIFRALADNTRLRILHMLLNGELCVCDIVSSLQAPQPTISRHLMYLRKVGLVSARKDGIWNYYQLDLTDSDFDVAIRNSIEACGQLSRMIKDQSQLQKVQASCCE